MSVTPIQQVIHLIEKSKKILVLPSMPADGDSLGGAIALYLALRKLNKEVTAVCADPIIPDAFKFLPHSQVISKNFSAVQDFIITLDCEEADVDNIRYNVEKDKVNIIVTPKKGRFTEKNVNFHYGQAKYDLIIVLDAGDLEQLGKLYEDNVDLFYSIPLINIDHHPSNSGFGKINLVDITAAATTEILYELIKELRPSHNNLIDEDVATALLTGIITDTGSFQNSNTTPKSLEIAAELVNLGARQQEIIKNIFKTKQLSTLKLWGKILSKINYDEKHHLVWSVISAKDFEETDSSPDATGGIIDELMTNAPGAEIIILLKEKDQNLITGSIRTTSPFINASEIAALFGGGGHTRAAGFRMPSEDFEKTVGEIISRIKDYQTQRVNLIKGEKEQKSAARETRPEKITSSEPVPTSKPAPVSAEKQQSKPPVAIPLTAEQESPSPFAAAPPNKKSAVVKKITPLTPDASGGSLPVNDLLREAMNKDQKRPEPENREELSKTTPAINEPAEATPTTPEKSAEINEPEQLSPPENQNSGYKFGPADQ